MKEVESKYKSLPFWSWNDKLEKDKLLSQIEWMKENGMGGFFMHARGGLRTEYLSDEWMDLVDACAKKAEELGMLPYVYDENGWPSGFVGGTLLEIEAFREHYLTSSIGEYDENALVSYNLDDEVLTRATSGENCLNVYEHVSPSTVDILNPVVVDAFLERTHERYKNEVRPFTGFFTDEPQLNAKGIQYSQVIVEYLQTEYGENVLDRLGLLFVKKEGYRDFRYKYYKTLQTLMLKNWAEKYYRWCDEHGYQLTGHYLEERRLGKQIYGCCGVMPFYEFEHIPGIDYLGPFIENTPENRKGEYKFLVADEISPKQVGSVAAQLGKKQTLAELYGMCGWNITPKELKKVTELLYVNGVNLTCQHLVPYSELGQRKRDYPIHFVSNNGWIKNFKEFNDYFSVLGKMLSESKEIADVAVLSPIRSCYFEYNRRIESTGFGVTEIDNFFANLVERLGREQVLHHYIDETILLRHGKVDGNELVVGDCRYKYLILPTMYTMDASTEKLLRQFLENGGKVWLAGKKPTYLEGQPYAYEYLHSTTTLAEMRKNRSYVIKNGKDIRTTLRMDETGRTFIYAVNFGEETNADFSMKGVKSFISYDILKDEEYSVSTHLHFDEGQSYILYPSEKKIEVKQLDKVYLNKEFTIQGEVDNYLALDFVEYSFNGRDYFGKKYHMDLFDTLLQKRYKGELYLKYTFECAELVSRLKLLTENNNIRSICINGKEVEWEEAKSKEDTIILCDLEDCVHVGVNEILLKIDYYQDESVYYALYGKGVSDSLRNCIVYNSTIETIYLCGNFGLYHNAKEMQGKDNIWQSDKFMIVQPQNKVSDLIIDGYPFLRGDITLTQDLYLENPNVELCIRGKFQLLDVYINEHFAGRMMFSNTLDISHVATKGNNKVKLVLTLGNRNLLGELHSVEGEPLLTGPFTFERLGQWYKGKCKTFTPTYHFMKTIL